jgi:predicted nucleic-acid-binding protein
MIYIKKNLNYINYLDDNNMLLHYLKKLNQKIKTNIDNNIENNNITSDNIIEDKIINNTIINNTIISDTSNKNAYISLKNGLGDKLLDVIGFYIICKYLNYTPNIQLNKRTVEFKWGFNRYDPRLFIFNDIILTNTINKNDFYINSPNPSSSLCPYKVYEFIKKFKPEITFEEISNKYTIYSKEIIKPSDIITLNIPIGIENAYGIHLRKTDKVYKIDGDSRHENLINEFDLITNKLLEDVNNICKNENNPTFLIVSEDDTWKNNITQIVKKNKNVKILDINYTNNTNYDNYNSVLDMFCLSKCKIILQGVKYSTFSMLASILGNGKLINYSKYLNNYDSCLIHSWNSVIKINDILNFDIDYHKQNTNSVLNIKTNIR